MRLLLAIIILSSFACRPTHDSDEQAQNVSLTSEDVYIINIDVFEGASELLSLTKKNTTIQRTDSQIKNSPTRTDNIITARTITHIDTDTSYTTPQNSKLKDFFKSTGQKISRTSQNFKEQVRASKDKFIELFKSKQGNLRVINIYDAAIGTHNPYDALNNPNVQGLKVPRKKMKSYLANMEKDGFQVEAYYSRNQNLNYPRINFNVDGFNQFTAKGETVILIKPPLHFQARYSGIGNVRSMEFGGITITGGMRPQTDKSKAFLGQNYGILHSLDPRNDIARAAVGPTRHTVNLVEDFHPPTFGNISRLFQDAQKSSQAKSNLFVHCGFGGGRTGTMLAALKIFQNFKKSPLTAQVSLPSDQNLAPASNLDTKFQDYPEGFQTSTFVNQAVNEIRALDARQVENGLKISVETQNQFRTLDAFHKVLVIGKNIKLDRMNDNEAESALQNTIPTDIINEFGKNSTGDTPTAHIIKQLRSTWIDFL